MIDITLNETEVHMLLDCMEEVIQKQKHLIEHLGSVSDCTHTITAASIRHHADILFDMESTHKKLKAKAYWTLV